MVSRERVYNSVCDRDTGSRTKQRAKPPRQDLNLSSSWDPNSINLKLSLLVSSPHGAPGTETAVPVSQATPCARGSSITCVSTKYTREEGFPFLFSSWASLSLYSTRLTKPNTTAPG